MVGRIAYALTLSTGIFIDLFGHAICGVRIIRDVWRVLLTKVRKHLTFAKEWDVFSFFFEV
jgi:hypothetical protein